MSFFTWSCICAVLGAIPALLCFRNLQVYRPPPDGVRVKAGSRRPFVSVLIPARNESRAIDAALEGALASEAIDLEILVGDDASEDDTRARVLRAAGRDSRVRLVDVPDLPAGWCGKQHNCAVLAREARGDILVFVDADVRLSPRGLRGAVAFLESSGADLVSGIPAQETGSLLEILVIPLIHFILLGFLPLRRMRRSKHPSYGAGCGQLLVARRSSYLASGGHAGIRESVHDGIELPRLFRAAGFTSDLFDATSSGTCRMYRSARELWSGFSKNAAAGLGSPSLIVPGTAFLLGGQVVPFGLLASLLVAGGQSWEVVMTCVSVAFAYAPRVAGAFRFRQPLLGALLHPLGVLVLLAIQWSALLQKLCGRPAHWKGRSLARVHVAVNHRVES